MKDPPKLETFFLSLTILPSEAYIRQAASLSLVESLSSRAWKNQKGFSSFRRTYLSVVLPRVVLGSVTECHCIFITRSWVYWNGSRQNSTLDGDEGSATCSASHLRLGVVLDYSLRRLFLCWSALACLLAASSPDFLGCPCFLGQDGNDETLSSSQALPKMSCYDEEEVLKWWPQQLLCQDTKVRQPQRLFLPRH